MLVVLRMGEIPGSDTSVCVKGGRVECVFQFSVGPHKCDFSNMLSWVGKCVFSPYTSVWRKCIRGVS